MTHPISGEEWREMDEAVQVYDTRAHQEALETARSGIETHRKGDVTLRLVRSDGTPVSGLQVDIVLKRHAFPFGDQLWHLDRLHRFGRHETDEGFYWRMRFADVFNAANALCYWTERPENDGPKVEDVQGRNVTEHFAYCVDWATSQGLVTKGHPLFWSIDKCVPSWVKRYDLETQMRFAEVRVRNLVARFGDQVSLWDAVNEALWEPIPAHLAQRHWPHIEPIPAIADYVERVLGWVRDENPDARYLLNDYGTETDPPRGAPLASDGTVVTAAMQRQRYKALVRELETRGSPPDAIGLQSHTGGWLSHQAQLAVYDDYADLGIPIHITEFWANTRQLEEAGRLPLEAIEALQADYVANTLTCAFGHPAIEAFFFWGFMGSAIDWRRDSSHHLKPVYHRVRDLIHETWTTRETLTSDADGSVRFRGFYGDYALRYALGAGGRRGIPFALRREHSQPTVLTVPFV
jgi:GH35 family endo-1,4-beta-xylanase